MPSNTIEMPRADEISRHQQIINTLNDLWVELHCAQLITQDADELQAAQVKMNNLIAAKRLIERFAAIKTELNKLIGSNGNG